MPSPPTHFRIASMDPHVRDAWDASSQGTEVFLRPLICVRDHETLLSQPDLTIIIIIIIIIIIDYATKSNS